MTGTVLTLLPDPGEDDGHGPGYGRVIVPGQPPRPLYSLNGPDLERLARSYRPETLTDQQ